ncbi:MAG: hypothetical protein QOH72_5039, partial [Solirubrobacteraceae bacterium]|nr:hypothetical protein [Solirubrobacteraceae bacterium]
MAGKRKGTLEDGVAVDAVAVVEVALRTAAGPKTLEPWGGGPRGG